MKIRPVILCGGVGSRLWPLSSKETPKQFIKFLGSNKSLLQITTTRFLNQENFSEPLFITNISYLDILKQQVIEIGLSHPIIIAEPAPKNTAAALAIVAHYINDHFPNELIMVVPSDSIIDNFNIFLDTINTAIMKNNYQLDSYILLGVKPKYPETGFGYIKPVKAEGSLKPIDTFKEKPTKEQAVVYIDNGYLWNAGIFIFKSSLYLQELAIFQPDMAENCQKAYNLSRSTNNILFVDRINFIKSVPLSIDYAIIEKTSNAKVLVIEDVIWADIGSWQALYNISEKDVNGNVFIGKVTSINCKNCYVYSPNTNTYIAELSGQLIVNLNNIFVNIPIKESNKIKDLYNFNKVS